MRVVCVLLTQLAKSLSGHLGQGLCFLVRDHVTVLHRLRDRRRTHQLLLHRQLCANGIEPRPVGMARQLPLAREACWPYRLE